MYQVGIDIGSSAAKTVVLRDGEVWKTMEMATDFPAERQQKRFITGWKKNR